MGRGKARRGNKCDRGVGGGGGVERVSDVTVSVTCPSATLQRQQDAAQRFALPVRATNHIDNFFVFFPFFVFCCCFFSACCYCSGILLGSIGLERKYRLYTSFLCFAFLHKSCFGVAEKLTSLTIISIKEQLNPKRTYQHVNPIIFL